jgi:hypothetical protein
VLDAPYITYHCDGCSGGGTLTGPTAHKTQVVRCCGGTSKVPDEIGDEFAKLRKAWEPTHRRVAESKLKKDAEVERQLQEKRRQEYLILGTKL